MGNAVVHHVVPWRLTFDNRLSNLATLCRSCHGARPEHRWTEYVPGMEEELDVYKIVNGADWVTD